MQETCGETLRQHFLIKTNRKTWWFIDYGLGDLGERQLKRIKRTINDSNFTIYMKLIDFSADLAGLKLYFSFKISLNRLETSTACLRHETIHY